METGYEPNQYTALHFQKAMKPGFISVIIPVYEDAAGVRDTLASLNRQTIAKENYEIIVSNDGGDDAIARVCKEFNVKYIDITPNMGSYLARNAALQISSGEFIAFVDADIVVPAQWLKNGLDALAKFDYAPGGIVIDQAKIETITHFYDAEYTFQVKRFVEIAHFGPTANLFVKRSIFERIGGFDIRLKSGGDLEFGNRIFTDTDFTQGYVENNAIMHPPRGYKEYIKKLHRVTRGQQDLINIYPSRFTYIKKSVSSLLKEIVTPSKRASALRTKENNPYSYLSLYMFCWWIKAFEYYLKLRYFYFSNENPVKFTENYSLTVCE